jgi:hypothetical protein
MNKVRREPVLTWAGVHAIVNSAQITALHVSNIWHVVILLISSVSAALAARHQVTPVTK